MPIISMSIGTTILASHYILPVAVTAGSIMIGGVGSFIIYRRYNYKAKQRLSSLNDSFVQKDKLISETKALEQKMKSEVQLINNTLNSQQHVLETHIKKLGSEVNGTSGELNKLRQTSTSINKTEQNLVQVTAELSKLKEELYTINLKLLETQTNLVEKENALNLTIKKLRKTEEKLAEDTKTNSEHIAKLTTELTEAQQQILHEEYSFKITFKEAEIEALKADNAKMHTIIQTLEATIERFILSLKIANTTNAEHLEKIRILMAENKKLNLAFMEISTHLEQNASSEFLQANFQDSNVSMFRSR